jgi:hypothetical protein
MRKKRKIDGAPAPADGGAADRLAVMPAGAPTLAEIDVPAQLKRALSDEAFNRALDGKAAFRELAVAIVVILAATVKAFQICAPPIALSFFGDAVDEMGEIGTWITGKRTRVSPSAVLTLGEEWVKRYGFPLSDIVAAANAVSQPLRGAPVTKRALAREALDERRRSGLSWTQLARKFCNCGQEHDSRCTERLRRRVMELERYLGRLSTWTKSLIDFVHGQNPT